MDDQPRRSSLGMARRDKSPGSLAGLLRTILGMAVILGLLWYFGFVNISLFGPKEAARPAGGPQAAQAINLAAPPAPGSPTGSVEQTTTASIHRQQLAAAKVAQRQFLAAFEATKNAIDEWEKELTGWEAEGPSLLKSEDGKRIAGDSGQARRFRGIIRQTRPTSGELNAARQSAEDLARPVREALNNPEDASAPDATLTSTLQTLQAKAREARDSYRQARDAVRAMLAQAKGTTPGGKTLEEAVSALDEEDAGERAAAIDAEEKKAKDAAARKRGRPNSRVTSRHLATTLTAGALLKPRHHEVSSHDRGQLGAKERRLSCPGPSIYPGAGRPHFRDRPTPGPVGTMTLRDRVRASRD